MFVEEFYSDDEEEEKKQEVSNDDIPIEKEQSISEIEIFNQNKKNRVLIANDDDMQLTILQMIFQTLDFEVEIAENGFEALEKVQ